MRFSQNFLTRRSFGSIMDLARLMFVDDLPRHLIVCFLWNPDVARMRTLSRPMNLFIHRRVWLVVNREGVVMGTVQFW